jgi:hypothetical protein
MADNKSSSGIGFSGLLQVAFIVLKLCKVIDWSWWWVLSPSWIGAGMVLVILLIMGILWLWADQNKTTIRKKRIQTMEEYRKEIDSFRTKIK